MRRFAGRRVQWQRHLISEARSPAGRRAVSVHTEGNYGRPGPETPFLQLGEFKYGKPIMSRIAKVPCSLNDAAAPDLFGRRAHVLPVGRTAEELAILPRDTLPNAPRAMLDEGRRVAQRRLTADKRNACRFGSAALSWEDLGVHFEIVC